MLDTTPIYFALAIILLSTLWHYHFYGQITLWGGIMNPTFKMKKLRLRAVKSLTQVLTWWVTESEFEPRPVRQQKQCPEPVSASTAALCSEHP